MTYKQEKWAIVAVGVVFLIVVIALVYNYRGKIIAAVEGNPTTYSEDLVQYIIGKEGCELTAYPDDGGVMTIGFGHTGSDVVAGLTITQDQANTYLRSDLDKACNTALNLINAGVTFSQGVLNCLTDFEFNTGALSANEDLMNFVNNSDWVGAAAWLPNHYITAGGSKEPGLVTRRQWDAAQILS